jgi:hypothetical protein
VHLVYVHDRLQTPPPSLEVMRDRVGRELQAETRQKFNDEYVANLLARYEVIIEDEAAERMVSNR